VPKVIQVPLQLHASSIDVDLHTVEVVLVGLRAKCEQDLLRLDNVVQRLHRHVVQFQQVVLHHRAENPLDNSVLRLCLALMAFSHLGDLSPVHVKRPASTKLFLQLLGKFSKTRLSNFAE